MKQWDFLSTINVNDFKIAITTAEAAVSGGRALQRVSITNSRSGEIGAGAKGIRAPDGSVTVYEIKWDTVAGDPTKLVKSKFTLKSAVDDGGTVVNDMTFAKLTSTSKTATFK